MKTLHFALAALQRLEVAAQTSDWWNSQSDAFKEQYMKDHPRSRFARAARAEQEKTGKKAKKYSELFDKHFYGDGKSKPNLISMPKPKLSTDNYIKDSDKAVKQYTSVDTNELDADSKKNLKLLDSSLNKKLSSLETQRRIAAKKYVTLENKLRTASKEEKPNIRSEMSKLKATLRVLDKQHQVIKGKHAALVEKHPTVLKLTNTLREQKRARAERKAQLDQLKKEYTKLKTQLDKVQKTYDNAEDTGLRRQARLKLKELKSSLSIRAKELKKLMKVNK